MACAAKAAAASVLTEANRLASMPASSPAGFQEGFSNDLGANTTGLMWQTLAAVLVVAVIGAIGILTVKRLLPRIRGSAGKSVSVLETVYVGQRKAVHLLQVGVRKLLVASSPHGLVNLADVTDAFPPSEYGEVARQVMAGSEAAEMQPISGQVDNGDLHAGGHLPKHR